MKPHKRWPIAGTISMRTGAEQPTKSSVAGAIRWAVGGSNRPTSSFVTCGSSGRVPGGMRATATRCWPCAVPSITGPSIRCLRVINSGYGKRKNHRMLPLECIAPRNGPACWCVAHAGPTKPECTLLAVAELMQRICTYYNCALEDLIVQEGCQKCTSREFHAVRFMEKRHTNSGLSMELTGKHSIYTHGG